MRSRRLQLLIPILLLLVIPVNIAVIPAWRHYLHAHRLMLDGEFQDAVLKGDVAAVKRLLDTGVDPNDALSSTTALVLAAQRKYPDVLRLLLDRGARVNDVGADGQTALIAAATAGGASCVQLLLDRGADINARTARGETALSVTDTYNHPDVVELLLNRGAVIDPAHMGANTWLAAARTNNRALAHKLRAGGASINAKDNSGTSALARSVDDAPIVMERLLQWGADVNSRDHLGMTPLIFAAQRAAPGGNFDKVRLLIRHGADVNARMADGECALSYAYVYRRPELARLLAQSGAREEYLEAWKRSN